MLTLSGEKNEHEKDVHLYVFLRLFMLFFVLASAVHYQSSGAFSGAAVFRVYAVVFVNFLITSIFIGLFHRATHEFSSKKNVSFFIGTQVAYDIFFTTILIFFTGTTDSIYTVFYLVNILYTSIVFKTKGALFSAFASAVLYFLAVIFGADRFTAEKVFSMLTTVSAFAAIALLSGQLVEQLKKSKQTIHVLEKLNEEIVNSLDSGLLTVDDQNCVKRINRTTGELLGIRSMYSTIGKPLREVFPALGEINASGRPEVREFTIRGKKKRILISRISLIDGHSMILLRDLSEILDLEHRVQRQEHLAGIGSFSAGVAHELRNPIASISGAAQLLDQYVRDDAEKRKLVDILIRESERVNRLVDKLLTLVRPSSEKKEQLELAQFARECVESLRARPDFSSSGIVVETQIDEEIRINARKDQLRELFNSLLVNAMQALETQNENLEKKISVKGTLHDGFIELVVTDNGPGIPKEFRSRIFEPFFTTKSQGTGLGLAQVYKIVREYEGNVDVDTEEGRGTAMRIRIPA